MGTIKLQVSIVATDSYNQKFQQFRLEKDGDIAASVGSLGEERANAKAIIKKWLKSEFGAVDLVY